MASLSPGKNSGMYSICIRLNPSGTTNIRNFLTPRSPITIAERLKRTKSIKNVRMKIVNWVSKRRFRNGIEQ